MTKKFARHSLAVIARHRERCVAFGNYQAQTCSSRGTRSEMQIEQSATQHAALTENACVLSRLQQTMLRTKTEFTGHFAIRRSGDAGPWHDARGSPHDRPWYACGRESRACA